MVTTKLYGGAGNQMFQIANCLAHSWRMNTEYRIPEETSDPKKWPTYFKHFPNLAPYTFMHFGFYREQGHGYKPIQRKDQLCFDGYFQSYKYFDEYRDKIISSFAPAFQNLPSTEMFPGIIALHVRRGDYLEHEGKHPFVAKEYVKKAIQHFKDLGYFEFCVFSDDIAWCKEKINTASFPSLIFIYSQERSALEDMLDMSRCEGNIIANSTFSWWAAYLNKNPNKIVVTPHEDNWFGAELKDLDVSDLLLPEWVRIKYQQ